MLLGSTCGVFDSVGLEKAQEPEFGAGFLVLLVVRIQGLHFETTYSVHFGLFPFLQFVFWYIEKNFCKQLFSLSFNYPNEQSFIHLFALKQHHDLMGIHRGKRFSLRPLITSAASYQGLCLAFWDQEKQGGKLLLL